MKKIDYLIDPIIEFTRERAKEFSDHRTKYYYDRVAFAKEFETVSISLGRQCGKSMYIARTAKSHDLILCHKFVTSQTMKQRASLFTEVEVGIVPSLTRPVDRVKTYGTIWVDDASYMRKEDIDNIYLNYAGWTELFVLIG